MYSFKLKDDNSGEVRIIEAENVVDAARIFFCTDNRTLSINYAYSDAPKIKVSGFRADPVLGNVTKLSTYTIQPGSKPK
jgi:hypothetical protein